MRDEPDLRDVFGFFAVAVLLTLIATSIVLFLFLIYYHVICAFITPTGFWEKFAIVALALLVALLTIQKISVNMD